MDKFISNITSIYGNNGKDWLLKLPKLVEELAKKWQLSELRPVENLSYNYVLSGNKNGIPVILKISIDQENLAKEIEALELFRNNGAVEILNKNINAVLLKKAVPGVSLKDYKLQTKEEYISICCEVMKKLHKSQISQKGKFPNIKDWLRILDQDWQMPNDYLIKARKYRDELLSKQTNQILLHGDLHDDNIISEGNDWVIIDPKGVIGSSINEIWCFIKDIEKDGKIVANYFNFDYEQVKKWYFVQLILACCWNLEDKMSADKFLELANKVYSNI